MKKLFVNINLCIKLESFGFFTSKNEKKCIETNLKIVAHSYILLLLF